jgi:hypothetical protein
MSEINNSDAKWLIFWRVLTVLLAICAVLEAVWALK